MWPAKQSCHLGRATAVLGQVSEGHAVVGQDSVDPVGERLHDLTQERGAVELGVGIQEGHVGELRHPIDGQEHEQLAVSQAQLAHIDVDIADGGLGEALSLGGLGVILRQTRDAVPLEAAVQGAAGELGDALAQAAEHVVERQQGAAPELHDHRFLGLGQTVLRGLGGAHRLVGCGGALAPLRDRLGRSARNGTAKTPVASCDAWSSARTRGVVRAEP
jgi:hypothetical protein